MRLLHCCFSIFFYVIIDQDCVALPSIDAWTSTPPKDEVVVVCTPDRNDDVHDQAIFIGVIAYLGDDTIYVWSSLSRHWWSESASFNTTSRTLPYNRCCRWVQVGHAHWYVRVPHRPRHWVIGQSSSDFFGGAELIFVQWLRPHPPQPDLLRHQGAIIHIWYSPVSTLVKAYTHWHDATTAWGGGWGWLLIDFYLWLVL
jgi:hypothetical protein